MNKSKLIQFTGLLSLVLLFSLAFFKVDANASAMRVTTLDVSSFTENKGSTPEGWRWDYASRTLTLDNVDFEVEDDYCIKLPAESCNIVVKGNNQLESGYDIFNGFEHEYSGVLTVTGDGELNMKTPETGFMYTGDVTFKDVKVQFDGYRLLYGARKLTFDSVNVNATGVREPEEEYTPFMPLIGALDEDEAKASLTLKNCYVNTGGAPLKYNGTFSYIGYELKKAADVISICKGTNTTKAGKASFKSFKKDYKNIGVYWKVPQYASGKFEVYRSTKKKSGYKKIATTYKPYYLNKGCTFVKKYYYKIKSYSAGTGTYSWSDPKAVTTGLANPSKLKCLRKSRTDELNWYQVNGAKGFKIYRATKKKGTYKLIKTITSGSKRTYTVKRPSKSKKYYYKIRAYRKVGKKYYYSGYTFSEEDMEL